MLIWSWMFLALFLSWIALVVRRWRVHDADLLRSLGSLRSALVRGAARRRRLREYVEVDRDPPCVRAMALALGFEVPEP